MNKVIEIVDQLEQMEPGVNSVEYTESIYFLLS